MYKSEQSSEIVDRYHNLSSDPERGHGLADIRTFDPHDRFTSQF